MKKQFYRVKQLADQTFSRSGKSQALTDELQNADRKVENLRNALQLISKRLSTGAGNTQGQDPAAREKRLKKLPEYMLGLSMLEASNFDDEDSILKYILHECGKTEKFLANEIAEHELKVEQLVCAPLTTIADNDVPAIMKAKKHLSRLINEKESAANRYSHLERQKEDNPAKLNAAKEELEEAGSKVEAARDALAADMFALVAKEAQLAHTLLQYVKLQRAYHESALHSLQDTVPELERFINDSAVKPVFGYPLEEHLRVTGRTIAFPIELCVCTLHELGLNEEGLFRIAGGTSKVRRMKLSLNAGLFSLPLPRDYRDVHVVAGVLKSYLRELPEPLLTFRLYENFLAASRQPTEQTRLTALWEAIHLLPEANFQNLRYLIKFLAELTQNQSTNKMSASNVAIVISPNLLWAADETTFDMSLTAAVNCGVELLIKHASWFYSDPVPLFSTFTREDLLPDDAGFAGFGQTSLTAVMQEAAAPANGELAAMSRSMGGGLAGSGTTGGRHSRSNSHDASLVLVEGEMRGARSGSSLSDHSPPHGSPRPVLRRKHKPAAPPPPDRPPDRPADSPADKPAKPPRPVVSDNGKIISGVQTINRSTYKASRALNSISRDVQNWDARRQSLELLEAEGRARPVAAPRTLPPATATGDADGDVALRAKPAVPERPAALRPHSFRAARPDAHDALLERTHIYCDRQLPTLVTLPTAAATAPAPAPDESDDPRATVQRTHSSGAEVVVGAGGAADGAGGGAGLAASRQLSQSEGSITEAPAPRARPPRPMVPAPPPPTPPHDSTHL